MTKSHKNQEENIHIKTDGLINDLSQWKSLNSEGSNMIICILFYFILLARHSTCFGFARGMSVDFLFNLWKTKFSVPDMQNFDLMKQHNIIQLPAVESDMGVADQNNVCIHSIF